MLQCVAMLESVLGQGKSTCGALVLSVSWSHAASVVSSRPIPLHGCLISQGFHVHDPT